MSHKETNEDHYNAGLHAYAIFVACATFLLIIAGALVTSNDAGLSVPDWPTTFGTFRMPRMVGGVLYEHGHRLIAATVGLLTVILAVWVWRREPRRWVRRLAGVAVLAVIAQGVLGGITVLFYLPVTVSAGHATLAQTFFCIVVSLALFTARDWRWDEPRVEDPTAPSLRHLAVATAGTIYIQLILGAVFRHKGFGILPHIVVAMIVALLVAWLAVRIFSRFSSERRLVRSMGLLLGLVIVQIFLGIGAYMMLLATRDAPQPLPPVVDLTTAHVALGALVLAASVILTLQIFRRVAAPQRSREPAHLGSEQKAIG
ncbi:MAG: COX15/CtaA family protein [Acidobacteriia bacterium]|nr:COX15/CtaA family protein [Terriglobia bacterium]